MADITQDPTPISPDEIAARLEAGEILLVDVRETKEYDLEHIAGALLMPLSEFEPGVFPALGQTQVVLHCAIGKRSAAAGRMLAKAGIGPVWHMEGGLTAWKAAGLPIEEAVADHAEDEKVAPLFLCPTPGAVLREEFMAPARITPERLAAEIGVALGTVQRLIDGERAVDAELSLRLARYFSTAGDFWLQLQIEHDIERARHALGETIREKISPRAA